MFNRPTNKNFNEERTGTSTQIFFLLENQRKIFLPYPLLNVIGFKVKSVCWRTPPAEFAASTMLFLSCDDLLRNTVDQSSAVIPDFNDPTRNNVTVVARSVIASWILDKDPPANISPNIQGPNFEQPIMWLEQPIDVRDLTFRFSSNNTGEVTFDVDNFMFLVLEFYYPLQTDYSTKTFLNPFQ